MSNARRQPEPRRPNARAPVACAPLRAAALIALALPLVACSTYTPDRQLGAYVDNGEFARARVRLGRSMTTDPSDRSYILDQSKGVLLGLADGLPARVMEPQVERLSEQLRTQGLNSDSTVSSFFVGEANARVYKGEPFEQALGAFTIACFDATKGDWGNARAGVSNALFKLRDFTQALGGPRGAQRPAPASSPSAHDTTPLDTGEQLRQREQLVARAKESDRPEDLGVDYTPVLSDFEAGYVLKAIAARVRNDEAEFNETLAQLRQAAPRLSVYADMLAQRPFNAVIVAVWGRGPQKVGTGLDNAIATWRPRWPSDDRALIVVGPGLRERFPVITDTNRLAADLRWNNLEDLRVAKSILGSAMVVGGAVAASQSRDRAVQGVGLGLILAGALMKATAGADERHNELLPQRIYIAPLMLPDAPTTITLQVENAPESRLVLGSLRGTATRDATPLHFAFLPNNSSAQAWAANGTILYDNDATGQINPVALPWILGGQDVRLPSDDALRSYQRSGYLTDFSVEDLAGLYKQEDIDVEGRDVGARIGAHILEGGSFLYTPQLGSAGFQRILAQKHPAYEPKSPAVRELAERVAKQTAHQSLPQTTPTPTPGASDPAKSSNTH
jgi:hypothetical protein